MSKELILKMSMSADGFVGGPNGELDWAFPSMSDAGRQWTLELLEQASFHAMGRRAYEQMSNYWPSATIPLAGPMNAIPKLVFSRSGSITAPDLSKEGADLAAIESWLHPTVAGNDLVADVQRLKREEGKPILAHGGASFATSLIAANLVDVFHLVVHPVVLGRGLTIFGGLDQPLYLKLEDVKRFETGAMVKTYRPAYSG